VTRRYPSDPSVLVYLARAEASRGNAAQARAAYAQVLERIPGHLEALAYLGQPGDR
jgi:predicted Zn-dependent protease